MRKIAKTVPMRSERSDHRQPNGGAGNPFAVSTELTEQRGVFGDGSERRRSAFLYREIDFRSPFAGRFVYSGWWFRQKIEINGLTVWFRISWLQIFRHATFTIPRATAFPQTEITGRVEIDFTRGLMIRRFRLWIADELVYDEIN